MMSGAQLSYSPGSGLTHCNIRVDLIKPDAITSLGERRRKTSRQTADIAAMLFSLFLSFSLFLYLSLSLFLLFLLQSAQAPHLSPPCYHTRDVRGGCDTNKQTSKQTTSDEFASPPVCLSVRPSVGRSARASVSCIRCDFEAAKARKAADAFTRGAARRNESSKHMHKKKQQ